MFNALDIAIMIVFLAIIGAGFFNGVAKVSSALLAIYLATVCSAAFYRPLTDFGRGLVPSMGTVTAELTSFFLLFVGFTAVFTVFLARWLGEVRLPRRVGVLDNVGGAAIGIIVSGLAVTLAAVALAVMLQALNQTASISAGDPMLGFIRREIRGSSLVPLFLDLAPFFLRMLGPWFPGGLPPILNSAA